MGRWCLPFRELTYLTNGKGNSGISSSQLPFGWDMFVRRSVDGFLVDDSEWKIYDDVIMSFRV